MATKTQLKLQKGVRAALRVGKNRWQTVKIVKVVADGYRVSREGVAADAEDGAGSAPETRLAAARLLTPMLNQKPQASLLPEFGLDVFERLTTPPEVRFARAPTNGLRVVYKAKEKVFYLGTISGTDGNFTFVVLDSPDVQSPIRVATESAKIEPILDVKADKRAAAQLTEEQVQALITPNYSKLLKALRAMAEAEQSADPAELSRLCADVVKERAASGTSAVGATGVTLYTVVPQSVNLLKRTLTERSVVLKKSEFSLWDETPQSTAHRLGSKTFGVVAEWRPPKGAVAVELGALITQMLKNKQSVAKLTGRESAALTNLHGIYTTTPKYVLSHAPDSAYISGILAANKQFLKHVRMMDIEHVVDSSTGVAYLRLFQISNVLDELGLA